MFDLDFQVRLKCQSGSGRSDRFVSGYVKFVGRSEDLGEIA